VRENIAAILSVLVTCVSIADAADVILNEYNAVSAGQFLEDDGTDTYWERVEGNGGDWFELVVITDHLDMRAWQLIINDDSDEGPTTLALTGHDVWSDLRSGTIITVSEELGNNVDDYNPNVGLWWLNVKAADDTNGTYITASNFRVNNDAWQLTVTNDVGALIFGPTGEGIMPLGGVGGQDVCKLEENPSPTVTEASGYNAGQSSTFGSPNIWEDGLHSQDFRALRDVVGNDTGGGDVDECRADPNKTAPGICGCGLPDTDSDGDGTPDCNDSCPNDPGKTMPGQCGCGNTNTDSDNDGTADCNDDCPADPTKTVVGMCGCGAPEWDSDEDGVPDCDDGCPDDPDKLNPGDCGCGIPDADSDGDSTADCQDSCPADPNKFILGVCGCGKLDTDSDGDGVADCIDSCPGDPDKTAPGICGCGSTDVDSDDDSTLDCDDDCPGDPNKAEPGLCGCGVADEDSDGDGVFDCDDECRSTQTGTEVDAAGCPIAGSAGPCGAVGMISWTAMLLGIAVLRVGRGRLPIAHVPNR
jgi:hypothetical protein